MTIESFELEHTDRSALQDAVCEAMHTFGNRQLDPALIGALAASTLDRSHRLTTLKRALHTSALRVDNLPASDSVDQAACYSATLGYVGGYGHPFQWREQSDQVFQRIEPRPGAPRQSNGSAEAFDIHSDDSVVPQLFRPELLMLYGMHNDAGAATGVVDMKAIVNRMPRVMVEKALSASFTFSAPASFGLGEFRLEREGILEYINGRLSMRFPTYATSASDPYDLLAEATIALMRALADEHIEWTTIGPCTAMMQNNFLALHGRKAVRASRLLVRSYWGRNVDRLRRLQPAVRNDVFCVRDILVAHAPILRAA